MTGVPAGAGRQFRARVLRWRRQWIASGIAASRCTATATTGSAFARSESTTAAGARQRTEECEARRRLRLRGAGRPAGDLRGDELVVQLGSATRQRIAD